MRLIVKQASAILASSLILYVLILGVALAIVPRPDPRGAVDTQTVASTIFMTEPKYVYLNRAPLDVDRTNIVLVGGSNVGTGFVLGDLNHLIRPDVAIHNLGLGGANVTELGQVVDLVHEVQNESVRHQDVFVIGIWYGLFGENRLRWYTPDRVPGDTDLDIERYRYGFERRTPDGPVDTVPLAYRDAAVVAIYPLLFLDKASRTALRWVSSIRAKTPEELNDYILTEQEKDQYLKYWQTMIGPTLPSSFDEQFSAFDKICDGILSAGSRLVLVNLPLPQWHKTRSPYEAMFESRARHLVDRLSEKPGFSFLNMADLDNDADFYDEVHPKPRVIPVWANRLATALSPLLQSNTPPALHRPAENPQVSSVSKAPSAAGGDNR
jgi:hypothetical protein